MARNLGAETAAGAVPAALGDAEAAAKTLVQKLDAASRMVALAESCTGGLTADLIARVPGASRVLWGSFVSYTPGAKVRMLGLDRNLLETYGVVSRETACAMAEGALDQSGVFLAAAVTGLAGPLGDGSPVPVGTVWIATAIRGGRTEAVVFHCKGPRNEVRNFAALAVLEEILKRLAGDALGSGA
jgi:PncC family amidohydrolase